MVITEDSNMIEKSVTSINLKFKLMISYYVLLVSFYTLKTYFDLFVGSVVAVWRSWYHALMCSSTMNDMQLFWLTGRTFTHITSSSSWHLCILPKLWLVWGTDLPQATTSIGPATSHAQNVFYYTKCCQWYGAWHRGVRHDFLHSGSCHCSKDRIKVSLKVSCLTTT